MDSKKKYRKNIAKILVFMFMVHSVFACNNLRKKSGFELRNGDLLFQDLDDSSLSEAIERVTEEGKRALSFSHVGIVVVGDDGVVRVLEAISPQVKFTPLDSFLIRSLNREGKPKVVVGRIKENYQNRIKPALVYGEKLLGKPYDSVYVMDDSAYYCSELIYEILKTDQEQEEIFMLNSMTFKDPETKDYYPAWVEHYQSLGVDIPEGEPGLNPNGMSRSKNIDLIHNYTEGNRKFKK